MMLWWIWGLCRNAGLEFDCDGVYTDALIWLLRCGHCNDSDMRLKSNEVILKSTLIKQDFLLLVTLIVFLRILLLMSTRDTCVSTMLQIWCLISSGVRLNFFIRSTSEFVSVGVFVLCERVLMLMSIGCVSIGGWVVGMD